MSELNSIGSNANTRISISTNDEIGAIAKIFNELLDKIRDDSLKNQRLQKLFVKLSDSKYSSINWPDFFAQIDLLLSSNQQKKVTGKRLFTQIPCNSLLQLLTAKSFG